MAKTWTLIEAYNALQEGDKSAILDFGKRFPLATNAVSMIKDAKMLLEALPSHMTMRKLEMALKDGVEAYAEEDEEVMTPDEAKAKRDAEPKKPTRGRKKATEETKKPTKAAKADPEPEEAEDDAEETEDNSVDYTTMTAPELFKLCKQRGIKAEPKKKSNVYIELLEAADAEDDSEDDSDDDWDEEEAPAPKKAPAKGKAKPVKAKKEEDTDDWDI